MIFAISPPGNRHNVNVVVCATGVLKRRTFLFEKDTSGLVVVDGWLTDYIYAKSLRHILHDLRIVFNMAN